MRLAKKTVRGREEDRSVISVLLDHVVGDYDAKVQLTQPIVDEVIRLKQQHPGLVVAGLATRGYELGGHVACEAKTGSIAIDKYKSKRGYTPGSVIVHYAMEYADSKFMVVEPPEAGYALKPGTPVYLVDDTLGSGGTLYAAVSGLMAVGMNPVGAGVVVEHVEQGGRRLFQALMPELALTSTTPLSFEHRQIWADAYGSTHVSPSVKKSKLEESPDALQGFQYLDVGPKIKGASAHFQIK